MAREPMAAGGTAALAQASGELRVETGGAGFHDITREVAAWLEGAGAREGLLTLFLRHTSASLTIQENADPDVLDDLMDALERIAPQSHPYRHASEGSDDMPAHIKAMATATSLTIPVARGRMVLGTWQGLYVIEHRVRRHTRRVALHFLGRFEED